MNACFTGIVSANNPVGRHTVIGYNRGVGFEPQTNSMIPRKNNLIPMSWTVDILRSWNSKQLNTRSQWLIVACFIMIKQI